MTGEDERDYVPGVTPVEVSPAPEPTGRVRSARELPVRGVALAGIGLVVVVLLGWVALARGHAAPARVAPVQTIASGQQATAAPEPPVTVTLPAPVAVTVRSTATVTAVHIRPVAVVQRVAVPGPVTTQTVVRQTVLPQVTVRITATRTVTRTVRR